MPSPCRTLAAVIALLVPCLARGQVEPPTTARDYCGRGLIHEINKRYDQALADYTKAVELDPQYVDAWHARSSLLAARKDYDGAIADLTRVIELRPGDYPALFNRALYHESIRDYDGAIADYSEVLDGDADFSRSGSSREEDLAHTHHYRGRAYQWYKRDYPRAIDDYTRALELDPDIEMVRYHRGDAHHALGEYAKAQEDYEAALARDPDYPNLLNSWAWQLATCPDAWFRDGKRAVEMAEKANQEFGWKIPLHVATLAAAHAEAGQFDQAVEWQRKAIELLGPKDPGQRKAMQDRLGLYESGRPFREVAPR